MRSTKFPAVAAAAAILALTPAAASAAGGHLRVKVRKHSSAIGRCALSIRPEARQIVKGESAGLRGKLSCHGSTGATNTPVTLYGRTLGGGSFQAIGSPVNPNAEGVFEVEAPAVQSDSVYYASAAGLKSAEKLVKVAPLVTLTGPASATQLVTGFPKTKFKVSAPGDGGANVLLQRENSSATEQWGVIGRGQLDANGEYTFEHRFAVAGGATIRAVVRPHGTFSARGISDDFSYEISDREVNNLKIVAMTDPVTTGQSFELTGEVTTAATKPVPVTLLARSREGGTFQSVAMTETKEGKYKFTETPTQNTLYRVMVAGKMSGIIYEGVKRLLSAEASGTSVLSHQTLDFSGTISPSQEKLPVYLERKNAFGGGWYVIQKGEVETINGVLAYKIAHQFNGSGAQTFRIKVPGGTAFQTTASAPFVVQVTPNSSSQLTPLAPSGLPVEGQI